jgi:two-component sensor histidine kinase
MTDTPEPDADGSLKADTDGLARLTIADSGKGIPESIDIESAESLGFSLLPHLVSQINGRLELSREGGTRFLITFAV